MDRSPLATARRRADERGAVGGAEVLPLAVLVFAIGTLLIGNLWAVVDAKVTAEAAARAAVRRYVEAPDASSAARDAQRAADQAVAGMGRRPERLELSIEHPDGRPLGRCAPVVITVTYDVSLVLLPTGGGRVASRRVHARQAERVDPWRSGLEGPAAC